MMRRSLFLSLTVVLLSAAVSSAQEMPEMPKPTKEHAWLEQLVGEWDAKTEINVPDQPAMTVEGEEQSRMIGGFWYFAENTGKSPEMKFTGLMTLGYDPKTKKYVGTWVDSMSDMLWTYTGSVEGKKLTLEAKGPCPMRPGKLSNFKETLEVTDDDHKVFTSSIQEDDGSWTQMLKTTYTRKKK